MAPNNSIYVVLLCQKCHHACGGYNDPALNAFVYRPKLLSEGLLEPLVVLDGTTDHSRGNHWTSSHLAIEYPVDLHPGLNVEDINPTHSLLDDGDVESHPGPINWATLNEPSDEIPWLSWAQDNFQRYGPDGWWDRFNQKFGKVSFRDGKYFRNSVLIINPWEHWDIRPFKPS